MTEHKHAAFFRAIADGDDITQWQVNSTDWPNGISSRFAANYVDVLASHPDQWTVWRKPRTMMCNGFEVPAPMTEMPKEDDDYYLPTPIEKTMKSKQTWANDSLDKLWFERGLCHSTAEDAIARTKAMMGIDPKGGE